MREESCCDYCIHVALAIGDRRRIDRCNVPASRGSFRLRSDFDIAKLYLPCELSDRYTHMFTRTHACARAHMFHIEYGEANYERVACSLAEQRCPAIDNDCPEICRRKARADCINCIS